MVTLDRLDEAGQVRLGLRPFHLRSDACVAALLLNELTVERDKVDGLFSFDEHALVRDPWSDFVFNKNRKAPPFTGMYRRDLQGRNGRDFINILTVLVAKMSFTEQRNLPVIGRTRGAYLQRRWCNLKFSSEPSNDLLRIDVDGIRSHGSLSIQIK